jgi:hypothetical protein
MKVTLNVAFCLVSAFAVLGAPPVALAQVDSTGILPLRGTPRLEAPVPIQNQGSTQTSWTKYFVGQAKVARGFTSGLSYFVPQADGTIKELLNGSTLRHLPAPYLNSAVDTGVCLPNQRNETRFERLAPSQTVNSSGSPTGWSVGTVICSGTGGGQGSGR